MKPDRDTSAFVVLALAAAGLLSAGAGALAQSTSPAGRSIYVDCDRVDASSFASERPIASKAEPKRLLVFDPAKCPSGYSTCYSERAEHATLRIVRPYEGASFPRNVAPPKIRWDDRASRVWMLAVSAPGWAEPLRVFTTRRNWRPDAATWEAIKSAAEGGRVRLEIRGRAAEDVAGGADVAGAGGVCADSVTFRVSEHPADPLIIYRLVSPLFHGLKTPDIHCRDITSFKTRMFLPGAGLYCTNCHSFPGNPKLAPEKIRLAIAVRKQIDYRNSYRILGLYDFASREGRTLEINSFFMSWDPDGRMVAVTGGAKVRVRALITLETQEFYVEGADILIVDTRTLEARALSGAADPELMETMPTWSPDGREIVFARASEMGPVFEEKRFDLCRLPYNGGNGGKARPIPGASANEMSNYAPRFSPDGRWIVFNKADWSSLVAPTADLWIVSTAGGAEPRRLECNVDEAMDSHHSWSSNGRWLLFASKRDDGIFARLYLSEIDGKGHASPPVELPSTGNRMMCYNVPEFLRGPVSIDADDILAKTTKPGDR